MSYLTAQKRVVMTKRGSMEQGIHIKDRHKVSTIHFRGLSVEVRVSLKGFMARINGNKERINSHITTKIKMAMSTIKRHIQINRGTISKHMKSNKGELRKPSITFSKMRIKTQGITENFKRRCSDVSNKDKKKIKNIGRNYARSMKKDLGQIAKCLQMSITRCSKLLVS